MTLDDIDGAELTAVALQSQFLHKVVSKNMAL